jgi:hypothetical protein
LASDDSIQGPGDEKQSPDRTDEQRPPGPPSLRRWIWGWRPVAVVVTVFGLVQLVPYRIHNSPVVAEPPWPNPQTRELAVRACYNCHSNQTVEPWYSKIAPVSWLVTRDVNGGRAKLNFSEWDSRQVRRVRDAAETIEEGSMPPSYYTWFGLHREAKLTADEQATLIAGLQALSSRG